MSKTTSITDASGVAYLAAFLEKTLRARTFDSPTCGADVYDRDANHPVGSIIVEGIVNLPVLARAILDYQANVVDAEVLPADAPEFMVFKSILKPYTDRNLTIQPHASGVNVVVDAASRTLGVTVSAAEAPKIALAILEAAGVESADPLENDTQFFGGPEHGAEYAVMWLRQLAEHQTNKAKEAADRAKLEAEAYAYYRASCLATDTVPAPDWATAKNLTKDVERDFIAIATTAREIHGGGAK